MKLYDKVKKLLEENEDYRNSDKKLIWRLWEDEGYVFCGMITFERFSRLKCTTPESITRCRRKVQEKQYELRATDPKVIEERRKKEKTKGTFIYREKVKDQYKFVENKNENGGGHYEIVHN